MGWKSGLLALALAAGGAGVCGWAGASAAEPGVSFGRFDGRDYLLLWPVGTPTHVVVYLHAGAAQPFEAEASSGMLEALAADSAGRGYAVIAPASGRTACGLVGEPSGGDSACWRPDQAAEEVARLERLIAQVEADAGLRFGVRDLVAYAEGADLAAQALAEGRLAGWRKLGLLEGVAPAASLAGAATLGPLVYVHAAEGDPRSALDAGMLLRALVDAGYGAKTCASGDSGGAVYDARRFADFLIRFAADCRAAEPVR